MLEPRSVNSFGIEQFVDTLYKFDSEGNLVTTAYYHYNPNSVELKVHSYSGSDENVIEDIWIVHIHHEIPSKRAEVINRINPSYLSGDDLMLLNAIRSNYAYHTDSRKIRITENQIEKLNHDLAIPGYESTPFDSSLAVLINYLELKANEKKEQLKKERERISIIKNTLESATAECGLSVCFNERPGPWPLDEIYYDKMSSDPNRERLFQYIEMYEANGQNNYNQQFFEQHIGFFACSQVCLDIGRQSIQKKNNPRECRACNGFGKIEYSLDRYRRCNICDGHGVIYLYN